MTMAEVSLHGMRNYFVAAIGQEIKCRKFWAYTM
jgi:hypothetical protein